VTVLDVLARRRTGAHDDERVALVVEGGGSRATFSAGMAAAVEDLGVTPLLDDVYGVSAGSLNAAWLVAGMAREAMAPWTSRSVMRGTIDPRRLLRGGRVVDLEHLVEHVYVREVPMPFATILASPVTYHPMATDAATGDSTDLAPLLDGPAALRRALQASSTLPVLAGPPVPLAGRRWVDGGLSEPVAVHTALAQGATRVIVLRTQPGAHAPAEPPGVVDGIVRRWLRRHAPGVVDAWVHRVERARATEALLADLAADGRVLHVRPPDDAPAVSRTSTDLGLLGEALRVGHEAAARALVPLTQPQAPPGPTGRGTSRC
jgi:predicted patatin/cPLA2 family phospholipase